MAAVLPPKRGSSFPCLHLPNQTFLKTFDAVAAVAWQDQAPSNCCHSLAAMNNKQVETWVHLNEQLNQTSLSIKRWRLQGCSNRRWINADLHDHTVNHTWAYTKISQVVFFGLYDFTTLRRAAELQYSCNIAPNCVRGSREAAGKHLSARL